MPTAEEQIMVEVMEGVFRPLPLASGAILPNRLAKAAMEEPGCGRAGAGRGGHRPLPAMGTGRRGTAHHRNVMIDARALTGPGAALAAAASMAPGRHQITRLAHGKDPRPGTGPLLAFVGDRRRRARKLSRYRAWLPQHPNVTVPQADAPGL